MTRICPTHLFGTIFGRISDLRLRLLPLRGQTGTRPAGTRRGLHKAFLAVAMSSVLLLLDTSLPRAGDADNDYRLGAQDKLRIKVFEWRAARDEIFEWAALNAEYTVGASGRVSLPLIGELPAAGKSTSEFAQLISRQLMERMNLAAPPDTTVEVTQFRPFYIVGHVDKPGEYPFRPGLTLLQAVTIGGGLKRSAESGARLEREIFTTRGQISLYSRDFMSLLAKRARLQAELNNRERIEFPNSVSSRAQDPEIKAVLDHEQMVFTARRESIASQLAALKQQRETAEHETVWLRKQLDVHGTMATLLKKEFEGIETLAAKGLTTSSRKYQIERNVAQVESDRLRIEASLVKARQDATRSDMAYRELQNKRLVEITTEFQDTHYKLEQTSLKSETAQRLLYESEVLAPITLASQMRASGAQPLFKVIRRNGRQAPHELNATETTPLEPGDTVKVELAPPSDNPARETPVRLEVFPPSEPPKAPSDSTADTTARETPVRLEALPPSEPTKAPSEPVKATEYKGSKMPSRLQALR